jgi:cupin superfamily protein
VGGGALERCVGDGYRFAHDVWGRRTLLTRARGASFDDLLSFEDVDRLLTSTALRTPAFRLVRDGVPLPSASYTRGGRIGSHRMTGLADPSKVIACFRAGATIVLQGMHRYWPPLTRFCRDLELTLGHTCQVNAYVTPAKARGLGSHTDAHDVFVLQAFGRKAWEVGDAPAAGDAPGGRPGPMSVTLEPGESLYLPRGTPHAARAQHEVSGHLTVGVLATTWRSALGVGSLVDDPSLDESLPAGYHVDPDRFVPRVEERLEEIRRRVDKLDASDVAKRAVDDFFTSRRSSLSGGLVDAVRLDSLDDDTGLRRRPGSVCELRTREGRLDALLGDRTLRMPAWLEPAMRAVAEAGELRARDLREHLDPTSRLVLVRRLVSEGLLEVDG